MGLEERRQAEADLGLEKRREGEGIRRGERGLEAANRGGEVTVEAGFFGERAEAFYGWWCYRCHWWKVETRVYPTLVTSERRRTKCELGTKDEYSGRFDQKDRNYNGEEYINIQFFL